VSAARTAFAANWLLTRRRLGRARTAEAGARRADPGAVFLTTVVRPPGELAEVLAGAASRVARVQPERHHLYPPETIHLTVLGLAARPGVEDEVAAAALRHRPFAIEVRGLNLSTRTVFAELYPLGPGLRLLRRDLRPLESPEHGPVARWARRRIAHANVIRFAAPVDPRLVDEVGTLRGAHFGRFEVKELELVRGDKVLSDARTRTLGRFGLDRAAAQPG
jgi:hypothetical protein